MTQLTAFGPTWPQEPNKQLVDTPERFERLVQFLRGKPLVFDYETSGLEWFKSAEAVGIGLGSWDANGALWNAYVPFRHRTNDRQLDIGIIGPTLKALLEDPSTLKIAHNIKFEDHFSRKEGWRIQGPRYDTMVAARLYDENRGATLDSRAEQDLRDSEAHKWALLLDDHVKDLARCNGLGVKAYKRKYGYSEIPTSLIAPYCGTDTDQTGRLCQFYEQWGLSGKYPRIWPTEMRLTEILCTMEQNGLPIDVPYLEGVRTQVQEAKASLEAQIKDALGGFAFNPGSDDDVRNLLSNVLGYKWTKRTAKQQLAVDREVLEVFAEHNLVCRLLLRWRDAEKIDSTYTTSILDMLDDRHLLHGNLKQVGTNTGRLSCEKPNYQNFASDDDDRAISFSGKKLEKGGVDPWSVKRAFPVRDIGSVRVFMDYCLHPDTLVETTRGLRRIEDIAPGDKVYSYADRKITWGSVSRSARIDPLPAYEITFDNGQTVIASSDHKWPVRVREGRSYVLVEKTTRELVIGERMVPMKRCIGCGYVHLYSASAFEYTKEHLLVAEAEWGPRPAGHDVHHLDENKLNNSADNLEYAKKGIHRAEHSREKYSKQDHELRLTNLRASIKKRDYRGALNPNYGKRKGCSVKCPHCGVTFYNYPSQHRVYCSGFCRKKARLLGNNHKIVGIRFVGPQRMHAITVDDHHNFVLGCGVVTCNSQIELRVLAYYSRDPVLIDAYLKGQDIHDRTATEIGSILKRECPRRVAKIVAFGLSYCMSDEGLSRQAKIPLDEAKAFMAAFFQRYGAVASFRQELWAQARRQGNIWNNIFGRTRRLPDLRSDEFWRRKRAERQMVGSAIQGSAAELTKESLVRLDDWIKASGVPALLTNTVHDEIQIDCPRECLPLVIAQSKKLMEAFPEFHPIPIVVDAEWTDKTWADKKDYEESDHG